MGARLADVARRAEVGVGTASAVFSGRPVVAEATRARVLAAAAELGYVKGRPAGTLAAERLYHLAVPAERNQPVPG